MRPRFAAAAAAALTAALLAASPAGAADKGGDLDVLLSNKPADGQPIDAAGSGLRVDAGSSTTVKDAGLKEPVMGAKDFVDSMPPPPDAPKVSWKAAPPSGSSAKSSNAGATGQGGPKNARASGGDWSLLPADLRNLQWEQPTPDRLGELVKLFGWFGGGHGKAPLTPGHGITVGFLTPPAGASGTGHCLLVGTPAVPAKEPCLYNAWISETPGGPPLDKRCEQTGIFSDWGATVFYASKDKDGKVPPGWSTLCPVNAGTRYWCNVAGCAGGIGAPIGVDDYTHDESVAMSEGKPCTYGLLSGHFHDGVCTDDSGSTTPPPDNRPTCTNEAQKVGAECITCASNMPANCANVKLVDNCRTACR